MEKVKDNSLIDRFICWREKHISQNQFILVLSFVVGILSALAAFTLKHLIHFIQHLLTGGFDPHTFNWLYLVYPVIGMLSGMTSAMVLPRCCMQYPADREKSGGTTHGHRYLPVESPLDSEVLLEPSHPL